MQEIPQDKTNENDVIYILYVMLGFMLIIILRRYLMNKIVGYLSAKENTKTSEEVELTNEINKLKREAEIYNNPQSYVKYAKLERNIIKLQKQLESVVINKPVEENDNLSKVAYLKLALQILFYIINVLFIYSFRNLQLVVREDNLNKNIVFDYFYKDGKFIIPFYMILLVEGLFISNILENVDKVKKVFV